MKIWMPFELFRHPVDVYLGLSQVLPGSVMTSHITICRDVFTNVAKFPSALLRSSVRSDKTGKSRSGTASTADSSRGKSRSFPPRYIGFIYDLAFLKHPDAYPDSYARLSAQTDDLAVRADHIVTISEATKQDIIATYGVCAQLVTVAYPGVEPVFTAKGPAYRHRRGYFLSVGALKRQKNIPFLLEAFRRYLDTGGESADLILVGGDYWLDSRISETITRLRLAGRVVLTGTVPDGVLARYYRGARAFVSPSLREGFGLPVLEAMASGCPVIVTAAGSYPEIVGDAGTVVGPDGTAEEISKAMHAVTGDRKRTGAMRTRGVKRAGKFRWDSFADRIADVITRTVSGS